jgi:hypothetical protein
MNFWQAGFIATTSALVTVASLHLISPADAQVESNGVVGRYQIALGSDGSSAFAIRLDTITGEIVGCRVVGNGNCVLN